MKNAIRIASWLTVATTLVSTATQTRPDFSGVWKWVNAPKPASPPDLPPGAPPLPDSPAPPKHISTTIVQSATEMKVEYRSERAGREDVLTWVYKLDRSESVNMVGGALYNTTAAWKGDALVLTSTVPMEGQPDRRITDVYRIENGDLVIENTGADFIQVEGERIRSVQGYFDTRVVPEQLGLQVLIQPHAVGPFAFGTSTSVETGKKSKPGAFSITILQARSDEEIQKIKELSREIATEMLEMPGFMSSVAMTIGPRMRTVTAWETPEHAQQLMRAATHQLAMQRFFGPELASGGTTGVWIPWRINALWVRCPACARMVDSAKSEGICECGESLPTPMPYW